MNTSVKRNRIFIFSLLSLAALVPVGRAQSFVKLIKSVNLVGYTGDFDHFAVDYDRSQRRFARTRYSTTQIRIVSTFLVERAT